MSTPETFSSPQAHFNDPSFGWLYNLPFTDFTGHKTQNRANTGCQVGTILSCGNVLYRKYFLKQPLIPLVLNMSNIKNMCELSLWSIMTAVAVMIHIPTVGSSMVYPQPPAFSHPGWDVPWLNGYDMIMKLVLLIWTIWINIVISWILF